MKTVLCALVVCFALIFAAACSTPSSSSNEAASTTNTNTITTTTTTTTSTNTANTAATPAVTTATPAASNANISNSNSKGNANSNSNSAATTTTTTTASADFTASRALYAQQCAMCHGANGEGQAAGAIPSLKAGHALTHSDAELRSYITNGHGAMPAFKSKLSAEQISTMVKYIRQDLQGKK